MGFYTIMFHVKQQDRLTHMFRGGWAPRSQAQPIRVCDIIVLYIMGYYVITRLIKERINMTKETLKQTVNTITHLDSMKAVKVAFDLSESNQDSINKVMQIVGGNVDNINLLAERIAKLEKRLEMYEPRKN
jgi:hypothetical protein